MTRDEAVNRLRARAESGRLVAFRCAFHELPRPAQEALDGIAGELEEIADWLADTAEPVTPQPGVVGAEPDRDDGHSMGHTA